MKAKKYFYLLTIAFLVIIILSCYNAFNGNPISNFIGKEVVKDYLKNTYPGEEFRVEKGQYNFKFSEYSYKIIKIGEDPYAVIDEVTSVEDKEKALQNLDYYITVKGTVKLKVHTDGVRYCRMDQELSAKLSEEASQELYTLLSEEIPSIKSVDVGIEILKFQLPKDTVWDKGLTKTFPIDLFIVLDGTNKSADDCIEDGKKMQIFLRDNNINYTIVNVNANRFNGNLGEKDEFGYVKYGFSFSPEDNLTIKNVEEYNKELD